MDSQASLVNTHFFANKSSPFFKIGVTRTGDSNENCSVAVCFNGGNLMPSAHQYNNIEIVLYWNKGELGTKYAESRILPSSNEREYASLFLHNFLRCAPGGISHAIIVFANENLPTIFGGLITLSSKNMHRSVKLQYGVYSTSYTFRLPCDAIISEVRNTEGEFLQPTYRKVLKHEENWYGIIEVSGSEAIKDESLQTFIILLA